MRQQCSAYHNSRSITYTSLNIACDFDPIYYCVYPLFCDRWSGTVLEPSEAAYMRMMLGNVPPGSVAPAGQLAASLEGCARAEGAAAAILAGREGPSPQLRDLATEVRAAVRGVGVEADGGMATVDCVSLPVSGRSGRG